MHSLGQNSVWISVHISVSLLLMNLVINLKYFLLWSWYWIYQWEQNHENFFYQSTGRIKIELLEKVLIFLACLLTKFWYLSTPTQNTARHLILLKCVEMYWNVFRCIEMCSDVLKCAELLFKISFYSAEQTVEVGQHWRVVIEFWRPIDQLFVTLHSEFLFGSMIGQFSLICLTQERDVGHQHQHCVQVNKFGHQHQHCVQVQAGH